MWFGLGYLAADDAADGEAVAMLSLYRDDGTRLMRIGAPPGRIPELARMLRAASEGAPRGLPCCESCRADLGMPDLDGSEAEGDACAST